MSDSEDDTMSQTSHTSQTSEWRGFFSDQESNNRNTPTTNPRASTVSIAAEDEVIRPTIELLKTKDYTNVSRLAERDHLTDENWHEWKDRML